MELPPAILVLAMVCLQVGLLCQFMGFTTDSWVDEGTDAGGNGLWDWCSKQNDVCVTPEWLRTCRTYGGLGLIGLVASMTAGLFVCIRKIPLLLLMTIMSIALGFAADLLGASNASEIGLKVMTVLLVVFVLIQLRKHLQTIAAGMAFASAFCILQEVMIYKNNVNLSEDSFDFNYGYSLSLTAVAFLLSIAAGILFLAARF